MQAKGTAVKSLKDYIIEKHGRDGFQQWLEALPPASRAVYEGLVLSGAWYPFEDGLAKPMAAMDRMFYQGGTEGSRQQGRYTAENNLHGIYRMFVRVTSPQFLIRNTAAMWHSYYEGSDAAVTEVGKDRAVLVLSGIDPANRDWVCSVAGWIERALEICGCRQIKIGITDPAPDASRLEVSWQ